MVESPSQLDSRLFLRIELVLLSPIQLFSHSTRSVLPGQSVLSVYSLICQLSSDADYVPKVLHGLTVRLGCHDVGVWEVVNSTHLMGTNEPRGNCVHQSSALIEALACGIILLRRVYIID
jgi:hypothetical protein